MKKGSQINWIIFGFIVFIVFSWFGDDSEQVAQKKPAPVKQPPIELGLTPPWPPLAEDDQSAIDDAGINQFESNIYLVLDGSGSMADDKCADGSTKMEVAKRAVAEFVRALPANVAVGLAAFDTNGLSERVALATGDRGNVFDTVRAIEPGGGTPLKYAIRLAYERLTEQANAQLGYGEYQIVVITDGAATSGQDPRDTVNEINRVSPVVINTVGFCIGVDHALNQTGRTLYTAADDYNSLRQGLDSVLAESPDFKVLSFN